MVDWVFDIPFVEGGRSEDGADCWGLVVLFYEKELGISLPKYEDVVLNIGKNHEKTMDQVDAILDTLTLFEPTDTPEYGDVVLLNMLGRPVHTGIVIAPNQFIHTTHKTNVAVENYSELKWNRRVQGFYRLIR